MRHSSILVSIAALGALAACGPVPRPFAHQGAPERSNPLIEVPAGLAVRVDPPSGLKPGLARIAAGEIAARLEKAEVPATTEPAFSASLVLSGVALPPAEAETDLAGKIRWRLTAPSGDVVSEFVQLVLGSRQGWEEGDPALAEVIGSGAVGPILGSIGSAGPAAAGTPAALRRVRVSGVSGAPGDGDTALADAVRRALLRKGAGIVGAGGESDYQIVGKVDLTPPSGGRQEITIRWVVSGADGSELGDVVQRNAIRAGALDRPWGAVAGVIATAAGPGIIEVMDKAEAAKSAARPGR